MSGKKTGLVISVLVLVAGSIGVWKYLEQSKQDNAEHRAIAEAFLEKQLQISKDAITEFKTASVSKDGVITITGLNVFPFSGENSYSIDKVIVHKFDDQNQPPNFAHLSVSGARVSSSSIPNPQAQFVISQLGYDELLVDADIDFDYKPNKKSVLFAMDLSLRNAITIKLNLALEDIDKSLMQNNKAATNPDQLLLNGAIKNARLQISDQSLLGRVMKLVPPQTQELFLASLDAQITNAPSKTDREAMEAVRDFLKNHGTIKFSIDPPKPISFMEIRQMEAENPQAIPSLLNISITNK